MTPRRLVLFVTLIVGATLAIGLPVAASDNYKPPVQETSGVPDGSSASQPGHVGPGKKIFVTFCGKCHVMNVVNTKGTIGPNLDRDKVSYTGVVNAVIQGVGGIQAEYLLRALTFSQIYDVAKFVTTQRQ
jgi:cytochrome c5